VKIKLETKIVDKVVPLDWVVSKDDVDGIELMPKADWKTLQEKGMNAAVSEAIMADATTEEAEDVIVSIVSKIETTQKDALFDEIRTLLDGVDQNYFQVGGYLDRISKEGNWNTDLYDSFREAVEAETGVHYRKAMYLMNIYNSIVEAEIPWSKIEMLAWSKLKEVADILTLDNVDEWVAKIMGPPELTVMQIHELVKAFKLGSLEKDENVLEETPSTVTSISFKVHKDQKENIQLAIDKAMAEAETEFAGVALDAICMNYLSGGKAAKPKPLSEVIKAYQPEEVLEAFAVQWPDIDVKATM
jgi:hypothetical protein